MNPLPTRARLFLAALVASALVSPAARADVETSVPPPGLREHTPEVHALTNARLVLGPGRVIPRGTLVIRDGVITAAGANVSRPPDAVVWSMDGLTIYPGFIDAYTEIGLPRREAGPSGSSEAASSRGAAYWNRWVTPQFRADREFAPDTAKARALRSQGFTTALTCPPVGVIKGTSAIVELGDVEPNRLIVKRQAALHVALVPPILDNQNAEYPTSPMGAYALVRQALLDAAWYADAHAAWAKNRSLPRPEANEALAALGEEIAGRIPLVIDTPDERYAHRADRLAREFGLDLIVRGSGREYRRLDAIRASGRPVIVPLNFPSPPRVENPDEALQVPLEQLMHWDLAPENPSRLARAGVRIALTAEGLPDSVPFLTALRQAVRRGLDAEAALRALTVTPAALFGLADRMGTLDPGRIANIVVADGDLFADRTKIREVWVDGRRFEIIARPAAEPRGEWRAQVRPARPALDVVTLKIGGEPGGLSGSIASSMPVTLKAVSMAEARLAFRFAGDSLGLPGIVRMAATVSDSEMIGEGTWPDGADFTWEARRTSGYRAPPDTTSGDSVRMASFLVRYPLSEFGRTSLPAQPRIVLFRDATVWTSGPGGTIEHGSVLVERGRIRAVGRNLKIPAGALVVECAGRHLTPGIVDCHSHTASDGGINESGQTVTAEVRVGDFIDPDDVNIYRHLAGGLTTAHVLHGSANTIGGQNQIIKMRWGMDQEEMKLAGAIPTLKLALGENVKQSNWGDKFVTRYPQTRMGVEQLLRDEFRAARDYEAAWRAWDRSKRGIRPRRDLELETIVEVLNGKRRIHCHSYRQDEMLMLMRICDDFGIKNVTFQHALEGYKVADELAKRGFGASTFSDWWAYKMEVYDAIPYNGTLMRDAGVLVSFNSDSWELARRLNTEAAKAEKYGALSDVEALKLVTLNPAIQLEIADQVGSIEVGKAADLVLWSGPPLSTLSRCEQTWIEGRKYFDRVEDQAMREEARSMRGVLIQKILGPTKTGRSAP